MTDLAVCPKPLQTQTSSETASIKSFSQIEGFVKSDRIFEHSRLGPWKKWSRLTSLEKLFLNAWFIALISSLAFTFVKIIFLYTSSSQSTTYALILIVASFFSLFYVTTAVYQEQPHEMIALCITNGIVLGYVIIDFTYHFQQHPKDLSKTKIARLIFTALFSVVLLPLSLYLAHRYWSRKTLIMFSVGSVNPEQQCEAQLLFMFLSAITFDLQLQLNFLILVLREGVGSVNGTEIAILVVGLLISVVWAFLGRRAACKEHSPTLIAFVVLSFPNFIYAGYAFATVGANGNSDVVFSLTLLSGVSAVSMRLCILMLTIFLYQNFGKGLKDNLFKCNLSKEVGPRQTPSTTNENSHIL